MQITTRPSGLIVPAEKPPSPTREEQLAERRREIEAYDREHACCPRCGGTSFEQTCVGYIGGPDRNRCTCLGCGWTGIVHDCVSYPEGAVRVLQHVLQSWERSVKQFPHESIPAAFSPLAHAIGDAQRLLDAMPKPALETQTLMGLPVVVNENMNDMGPLVLSELRLSTEADAE